jgi:hypothetical protein
MRPKSLPLKTPFWMKNERHAAWERFPQIQNERRAAWERVCGRDGPDWSPQQGPQKTSQTVYFKLFWTFIGGPSKHPSCAHEKMEQPKWAPKSAHSECSKYLVFRRFLKIVVFCLRFWRAILFRFVFKMYKKTLVLYIFRTPSLRPCWTPQGNIKNPKTSATLHENASAQKKTNATLHGNAFRLLMGPQSGPPQIAQSIYFKLFGTFFRPNGKTSLNDMERKATGHRKTKRQSETTKTVAPQVLENVDYLSNA